MAKKSVQKSGRKKERTKEELDRYHKLQDMRRAHRETRELRKAVNGTRAEFARSMQAYRALWIDLDVWFGDSDPSEDESTKVEDAPRP